jgi:hypothetical protein
VYLANNSVPLQRGDIITAYGTEELPVKDVAGAPLEPYIISVPGRDGYFRIGRPWEGAHPAVVGPDTPVGHIINDGGILSLPTDRGNLTVAELGRRVREYEHVSLVKESVAFVDPENPVWDMLATKAVQPGEELFLRYGAGELVRCTGLGGGGGYTAGLGVDGV